MDYLWTKGVTPPEFKTLDDDKSTEVLIIGGGMAGVLCALELEKRGVKYMLVEGKRMGLGITKGTTAVLTAQHDTLYQDMAKKHGEQNAKLYLSANLRAVERFRALSRDIPCDFEEKPSVMYSLDDARLMEREAETVRRLGFSARFITKTAMPFPVAGAVEYPNMAQFHPLKFLYAAANRLNIYENTFVDRLSGTTAFTKHGAIRAKKVIVATHYPFVNRYGMYFMKLYQQRSFVIALENAPMLNCTIEDAADNGIYLRNYGSLLLVGGGDRRTGKKGNGFEIVRAFARRYFPDATEKYAWANQDCVGLDGVPYIGRYSSGMPDVYVASGFGLWGMTTSMVASEILADCVMGRESQYAPAFLPNRSMLSGQLFRNLGETLLNFATPTARRCAHLGCALKWNAQERTWDCSCHGSRFDEHGKLIDNPAMKGSRVE